MDEIEGFKQYLGVAEEDRLNYLHPAGKNSELVRKISPYAIALDVENRLGGAFRRRARRRWRSIQTTRRQLVSRQPRLVARSGGLCELSR